MHKSTHWAQTGDSVVAAQSNVGLAHRLQDPRLETKVVTLGWHACCQAHVSAPVWRGAESDVHLVQLKLQQASQSASREKLPSYVPVPTSETNGAALNGRYGSNHEGSVTKPSTRSSSLKTQP